MSKTGDSRLNDILTVDYEDWFHILDPDSIDPSQWEDLPSTIEADTLNLLDILGQHSAQATFFLVGWLAERTPDLVREIVQRGHEVGTHGYFHIPPDQMSEEMFRSDLLRSIETIERTAEVPVRGYRAPGFGVRDCKFAYLDVLQDYGLSYDSSQFPGAFPGRGRPGSTLSPYSIESGNGPFWEIPVSALAILKIPVAFSGGGFLRLLPQWFILRNSRRVHLRGDPVVYYVHPRDLNPHSPEMPTNFLKRFRFYGGRRSVAGKLESILGSRRCTSVETFLAEEKKAQSA